MAGAVAKSTHPYVVSRKDYCGGSPIIKGTKFPVRSVVSYVLKQGPSPEELLKEFSNLTLAQVYDALSYYYDHHSTNSWPYNMYGTLVTSRGNTPCDC